MSNATIGVFILSGVLLGIEIGRIISAFWSQRSLNYFLRMQRDFYESLIKHYQEKIEKLRDK